MAVRRPAGALSRWATSAMAADWTSGRRGGDRTAVTVDTLELPAIVRAGGAANSRARRRSTCCAGPTRHFGTGFVCRLVDGRRGAGAPRRPGAARRRRDLPRHRLPLRRDDRHPGRGRRDDAGRRAHASCRGRRWPSRTPSSGRGCTSATRTGAARAQGRAAGRALRRIRPGRPGCAGTSRRPGRTPVVDVGRGAGDGQGEPASPRWTQDDVDAYIAEHGVLVNPLLYDGYGSVGCAPCTRASTPGPMPGPGAGPARPRPSAGYTADAPNGVVHPLLGGIVGRCCHRRRYLGCRHARVQSSRRGYHPRLARAGPTGPPRAGRGRRRPSPNPTDTWCRVRQSCWARADRAASAFARRGPTRWMLITSWVEPTPRIASITPRYCQRGLGGRRRSGRRRFGRCAAQGRWSRQVAFGCPPGDSWAVRSPRSPVAGSGSPNCRRSGGRFQQSMPISSSETACLSHLASGRRRSVCREPSACGGTVRR